VRGNSTLVKPNGHKTMTKKKKMKHKALSVAAIAALLPHLFCCVLPAVSSVAGVGAALGLSFMNTMHFEWVHAHEEALLVFSGFMIAVAGFFVFNSEKMDCHDTGCCHGSCQPKKHRSLIAFYIALGLFAVNLMVHLFVHQH